MCAIIVSMMVTQWPTCDISISINDGNLLSSCHEMGQPMGGGGEQEGRKINKQLLRQRLGLTRHRKSRLLCCVERPGVARCSRASTG